MGTQTIRIKRVYAPAADGDGLRVLVDRLWPRGISREKGRIDLWVKDVAPSDALRKSFHGHPEMWEHFVDAYRKELALEPAKSAAASLLEESAKGPLTLLFAAREEERNNAAALKSLLQASR